MSSLGNTCEFDFSLANFKSARKIQNAWRIYSSKKMLAALKSTSLSSSFFPFSDVKFTISRKPLTLYKKKQKFLYPNGGIYQGETRGGFRNGYGKMHWPNGSFYEGNWSFGYPSGYGKFVYVNGDLYEGKWINPFPSSKQSISSSTKSFDESFAYDDGYCNIYLVWLWFIQEEAKESPLDTDKKTKLIFQKWQKVKEIMREAQEQLTDISEFIKHKPLTDTNAGTYQGDLLSNTRQGIGKYTCFNKDTYIGQWYNNAENGLGKSTWNDGSSYLGFYKNSCKEGVGKYIWSNLNCYLGEWENNLMQGIGKYFYTDGREYFGEWKQGFMDGFGIFTWKDGRTYEGEWVKGKKHGKGNTVVNGIKTINNWECGKIID